MNYKEKLIKDKLPKHIAIIMDGNGRWAKNKGTERIFGHKHSVKSVREVVEGCAELQIPYLTLFAFSTENWNRPKREVNALMSLLVSTLNSEKNTLIKNNIRLNTIGFIDKLPKNVQTKIDEIIKQTKKNNGLTLTIALSYGSRQEIVEAIKCICIDVENNKITTDEITEKTFSNYLNTANMPDPDLLIRTSGEYRISNFLLWQIAYSELYFTNVFWPDFHKENLYEAIYNYQCRERRFGKTSEQLEKNDTE